MTAAPPNLVLIGMMGSGKTEIGRLLSSRLGWDHVDTDALVAEKGGVKISEIFKYEGEKCFRRLESKVLHGLGDPRTQVISTGGGIVTVPCNRRLLRNLGVVFYLNVCVMVLAKRLGGIGQLKRPLLQKAGGDTLQQTLSKIFADRHEQYLATCHEEIKIESPYTSKEHVVNEVHSLMKKRGHV